MSETDGAVNHASFLPRGRARDNHGESALPLCRLFDPRAEHGGTTQQMAAIAAIDDTLTALDFLIARPDTDDSMTTLVGGSAGAVTVDYVAYALDDFGIERPPVAAVVSNWGRLPVGRAAATLVGRVTWGGHRMLATPGWRRGAPSRRAA
jgi:hypothetical protein